MNIVKPYYIADRDYEDECIIYNLQSNDITILENVASDIWSCISDQNSIKISEIVNELLPNYNVDKSTLLKDVTEFCNVLASEGLIIFAKSTNKINDVKFLREKSFTKTVNNIDIEQSIVNRLANKNQMFAAMIEVTQKCNEQCIHCYARKDNNEICTNELSKEEIFLIIDQLAALGCLYLIFTGGEVFYRKDFMELVKYARSRRFVIDIYTNGQLINTSNIKSIRDQLPRAIYLSLYSMNPAVHDSITNVKGSHYKTIQAISLLRENQIPVAINVTIIRKNADDYKGIAKFAESVGADFRISYDISPKYDGNTDPLKYRLTNKEAIYNLLRFSSLSQQITTVKDFDPEMPVCSAGVTSLTISASGDVYPCISLRKKIGNIREHKISDLWHSQARTEITNIKWKHRTNCIDCLHKDYCSPCMGISYLEHGDMYSGNLGDCFIAQCKHDFLSAL